MSGLGLRSGIELKIELVVLRVKMRIHVSVQWKGMGRFFPNSAYLIKS